MAVKKSADSRSGLTKADLIDVVYDRHGGLTKDEAAEIVDAIFKTVKMSLGEGRTVRIKNFGTFEITERPGRTGVNPVSGEKIFIRAHKGLSFRPARRLKDAESLLGGMVSAPRPGARVTLHAGQGPGPEAPLLQDRRGLQGDRHPAVRAALLGDRVLRRWRRTRAAPASGSTASASWRSSSASRSSSTTRGTRSPGRRRSSRGSSRTAPCAARAPATTRPRRPRRPATTRRRRPPRRPAPARGPEPPPRSLRSRRATATTPRPPPSPPPRPPGPLRLPRTTTKAASPPRTPPPPPPLTRERRSGYKGSARESGSPSGRPRTFSRTSIQEFDSSPQFRSGRGAAW